MNVNFSSTNHLLSGMQGGMALKSTQEKLARQQARDDKIHFFESQMAGLKNMKCETLEDIKRKLEMFRSYQDSIAAAKQEYNNSQVLHMLDEAQEIGEKIAKAAEKMKPKTEEERKEELAGEAMGTDEEKGVLSELLEKVDEIIEQMQENALEEKQGGILDGKQDSALDVQQLAGDGADPAGEAKDIAETSRDAGNVAEMKASGGAEDPAGTKASGNAKTGVLAAETLDVSGKEAGQNKKYKPFDYYV